MTQTEMRELDCWIAEHVMDALKKAGWRAHFVMRDDNAIICGGKPPRDWTSGEVTRYTTDPAAAMEVLKKCVEKLAEARDEMQIRRIVDGSHFIECLWYKGGIKSNSKTLETAIALFAKEVFK